MTFQKKGKGIFLMGVFSLFLLSVLSLTGTREAKAEEVLPGKALFEKNCAVCHGVPVAEMGRYAQIPLWKKAVDPLQHSPGILPLVCLNLDRHQRAVCPTTRIF